MCKHLRTFIGFVLVVTGLCQAQSPIQNLTFQYKDPTATTGVAVTDQGTIPFPATQVLSTSTIQLLITNTGSAPLQVSITTPLQGVTTGNPVFAATPPSLTVNAHQTSVVTLAFSPTTTVVQTTPLTVSTGTGPSVEFFLVGTGINQAGPGTQLVFSFTVGSSVTILADNGTATFPNAVVGSTATGTFNVLNAGNLPTTINSISVSGQYFGITIPPLPSVINPGSILSIPAFFAPNALGTLTGTLGIDTQIFTLKGFGTAPPSLPSYTFTGVADTAAPAAQPVIGLSLSSPYSLDITGTLVLSFASGAFVNDPTIQFASGGLTVNFRIPANTTTALFGSASTIPFQTGTIAGTIIVTPSFSTGLVSLTPSSPLTKSIVIAPGAPVIRNVKVANQTANSFQVLISGFSTPRAVSQITLQFTGTAGANLLTTSIPINTDSAFTAWYQSIASATVGSQFTATVTIAVNGSISAVQSVAVTASNLVGLSNSMSTSLQ
jgi:hypothetical protein